MKVLTVSFLGAALFCSALTAEATIINVSGIADGSGFVKRPSGSNDTPPVNSLSTTYELVYDDQIAPADGMLDVPLVDFSLSIGPADYDPSNASAILTFQGGSLIGILVGGDANGAADMNVPGTDDFVFLNVDDTQLFSYTSSVDPGVPPGEFNTLLNPSFQIGTVSVTFTSMPQQEVPSPRTLLLMLVGLAILTWLGRPGTSRRSATTVSGTTSRQFGLPMM